MEKTRSIGKIRRDVATLVAFKHGVSDNYVRKVIRGDRENETIMASYME